MNKFIKVLYAIRQFFVDDEDCFSIMRALLFIFVITVMCLNYWGFLGHHIEYVPYIVDLDKCVVVAFFAKAAQSFSEFMGNKNIQK